jgi:hypothetical protein
MSVTIRPARFWRAFFIFYRGFSLSFLVLPLRWRRDSAMRSSDSSQGVIILEHPHSSEGVIYKLS